MSETTAPQLRIDAVAALRDPAAIRARAHRLLDLGIEGALPHFSVHAHKLDEVASYVADVIRDSYPALDIPYHGRWRHFSTGGYDRWETLAKEIPDTQERVRAAIDLAVVSVLLDAGAGAKWAFREEGTGHSASRSEGLAVASFYMFKDGAFSGDSAYPLQVDATGLAHISEGKLAAGFQVGTNNALPGLEGRATLIRNLAKALTLHPKIFGREGSPHLRPGHIFDYLATGNTEVRARDILQALLEGLSSIWPGRIIIGGQNLGDVWMHSLLAYPDATDQLMPFHKLSQWLTYSLLEPFEWAGITVTGLDELTGLAEYRNGGLFLDSGLITLKDPRQADIAHKPSDELIVEWRALTIALLDRLRVPVAERLGIKPEKFPLARLLEGGTWNAGRRIAAAKRPDGAPPLKIISDGTVF
jgi:Protein of unknown function (DUF1688)